MKLHIKNMFCPASKFFIKMELERMGVVFDSIEMGELNLTNDISDMQIKALNVAIHKFGLEVIEAKPVIEAFSH
jgi:hypothetical protein